MSPWGGAAAWGAREQQKRTQHEKNELSERLQVTQLDLRGTREHMELAIEAARLKRRTPSALA